MGRAQTLHMVVREDRQLAPTTTALEWPRMRPFLIELELIQSQMAQKPVPRGEVGCTCVAREVSVERGGMGV